MPTASSAMSRGKACFFVAHPAYSAVDANRLICDESWQDVFFFVAHPAYSAVDANRLICDESWQDVFVGR